MDARSRILEIPPRGRSEEAERPPAIDAVIRHVIDEAKLRPLTTD
jgi:hypothetical protein